MDTRILLPRSAHPSPQLFQPQLPQQLAQLQLPSSSSPNSPSAHNTSQQNTPYMMVSESLQSNTQTRTSPVPTNQTKHQKNTGQPARGQGSATRGQRGASSGRGGGIVGRQGSHSGQCSTHLDEDKSNESDYIPIGFTLDNFKSQLGNWTKPSLRQVFGENKTPWRKCGYNTFLAFSVKSAGTLGIFLQRDAHLDGTKEKQHLKQHGKPSQPINKKFSMQGFHNTTNNDDLLAADKIQLYDPLYEDLVTTTKPSMSLAKDLRKALMQGLRLSNILSASTRRFVFDLKLFTISNADNLTFYLLSATRYPGSGSFCKKLSNNPYWLLVAKDRWKAKETCKAYSHTREIQEVVNESRKNPPPAKKPKPSNETRSILQKKLNQLLGNTLGCDEQFFPKSANPASRLSERFPTSKYPNLKMVQSEESQLSDEMFALGLEAMETKFRKQWLANIEKGHFKITNTVQTSTTENNTTKTNTTQTNTTDP
ncbi:hypothetical protein PSHT_13427 [Puccinia striiformis]|uniref:Uncharacterized protein n=1 Tax=Puccinia striiformis TaxID=27350 RepID=A0A2S4UQI4_9BASI|nr:hypothetical protein PSHT_13427 [Puccinia striiformis]